MDTLIVSANEPTAPVFLWCRYSSYLRAIASQARAECESGFPCSLEDCVQLAILTNQEYGFSGGHGCLCSFVWVNGRI